ncbi:hypothetical protein P3C24_12075 [Pseudomonas proteolytica]|uniref:hypothetical protein n=1 Tax=Pseudomonas proteolytica TaxID=219574 RepID=UPI0023DEC834|nr:hypothetical protein [Pseudomonas proteolytica]MDF3161697.1 hypothetical protein [Pseudomonas proteolytica]
MNLYVAIFIAAISMPLASIAGICSLEFGYVSSIRQALGIGVLAGAVMLLLALILFLAEHHRPCAVYVSRPIQATDFRDESHDPFSTGLVVDDISNCIKPCISCPNWQGHI